MIAVHTLHRFGYLFLINNEQICFFNDYYPSCLHSNIEYIGLKRKTNVCAFNMCITLFRQRKREEEGKVRNIFFPNMNIEQL